MKIRPINKFKVVSTEGHKAIFATRKLAEAHIEQLHKEKQVGAFTEFRIYEIGDEK